MLTSPASFLNYKIAKMELPPQDFQANIVDYYEK